MQVIIIFVKNNQPAMRDPKTGKPIVMNEIDAIFLLNKLGWKINNCAVIALDFSEEQV